MIATTQLHCEYYVQPIIHFFREASSNCEEKSKALLKWHGMEHALCKTGIMSLDTSVRPLFHNFMNIGFKNFMLENPGIDPGTSHVLSERSTV